MHKEKIPPVSMTTPLPQAKATDKESKVLYGYLLCLGSHLSISIAQYFIRRARATLPSSQVQYLVFLVLCLCNFALLCKRNLPIYFPKPLLNKLTFLRGVIGMIGATGLMYSLGQLPLSEVIIIGATSPILTGILAITFLKEKFDFSLVLNVIFSIVGITFITKPDFLFTSTEEEEVTVHGNKLLGTIGAFVSAAMGGIAPLLLKRVGTLTNPVTLQYYFGLVVSALSPIGMINQVVVPLELPEILILVIGGLFWFTGHMAMAASFMYADASRLGMLPYSQILFAYMLEILIDGIYPDSYTVLGTFLIMSGFFILLYKSLHQNKA